MVNLKSLSANFNTWTVCGSPIDSFIAGIFFLDLVFYHFNCIKVIIYKRTVKTEVNNI